ncbi:hypothetical protein O7607_00070 [Micromonospora sp. WMMA1949]|uniref:hypothetical protein n=1 Tax=Micromonospora sp. WMMA1949 TaxID=3015162 RepID=UPI0022B6AC1B|nr:hypothetical protein [Micromonospora sp. WMMA1949]MCZ7424115.1 hypothetical protein [Micromonospora sp. WMMA1949]
MDEQWLLARGASAYAVMHADLHIRGRERASYRLTRVDGLIIRETLTHEWPGRRLAALWLYGPDFPRTSEVAESIAAELEQAGWIVLDARIQQPATPRALDLVPTESSAALPGIVIMVNGADDWSTTELTWLLSNNLVHRPDAPVRLLLTASTMDGLPALRAALTRLQADIRPLKVG